jgi:glycosyltransferase involved in cell wall biosynthesis
LAQAFTDFELLLIDDGSPDCCGAICDEYAQKDSRVRVFHKDNGGLSAARNTGIDKALGEYVYFLDSDDYIPENCLGSLVEALKERDYDIVILLCKQNVPNKSCC